MNVPGLNVVVVSTRNSVPRRTVLISRLFSPDSSVRHLCWHRDETSNTHPSSTELVEAGSGPGFVLRACRRLARGPLDVLLFSDLRLLPLAPLVARSMDAFVIYDRQEVPAVTAAQRLSARVPGLGFDGALALARFVEGIFFRLVDLVVSIPVTGSEARWLHRSAARVMELGNVPELEELEGLEEPEGSARAAEAAVGSSRDAPRARGRPRELLTLVYAGNLGDHLGLDRYLDLVVELGRRGVDARLLLAGHLETVTAGELERRIRERELEGLVEYVGWMRYEELDAFLARGQVALALFSPRYPKFRFMGAGASRKVFTYMARGLPVVTNGELGRVAEEVGAGVRVEYDDPGALADAVARLAEDPEARARMGAAGRRAVASRFNWLARSTELAGVLHALELRR